MAGNERVEVEKVCLLRSREVMFTPYHMGWEIDLSDALYCLH